jgi:hypothetical protein
MPCPSPALESVRSESENMSRTSDLYFQQFHVGQMANLAPAAASQR